MRARGRILFWQGGSLWIGQGHGRTRRHGHHAHQVTLPFAGVCRFRTEEDGDWAGFAGAFVHSERPHDRQPGGLRQGGSARPGSRADDRHRPPLKHAGDVSRRA